MRKYLIVGVSLLVLAALALTGSGGGGKLGTEENPIIWSFVPSQDSEEVLAGAQQIADMVTDKTGLIIKANIATEYAGVIEAMCNGEAHLGALNTFGYVLAHERKCADVAVASVRYGSSLLHRAARRQRRCRHRKHQRPGRQDLLPSRSPVHQRVDHPQHYAPG